MKRWFYPEEPVNIMQRIRRIKGNNHKTVPISELFSAVNLTQYKTFEGVSTMGLPGSDWPENMTDEHFLD